ncbi:MAG: hypothetical protein GY834_11925 [Bacteroidetes bacterium]|nr:hypothetical protein [Bacteroidota bacterium]
MVDQNKIYSWPEIRRIGNSKLVQGTILIPVLGYLILFSQWFFEFIGEPDGFMHVWKVYALYYGFTLIAVGSVIYSFRCPKVVRQYRSPSEYVDSEEPLYSKANMIGILKESYRLIKRYGISPRKASGINAKTLYSRMNDINDGGEVLKCLIIEATKIIDSGNKIEFIASYYTISAEINAYSRRVVFGFYVAGFIFVLIPSVAMFYEVIAKTLVAWANIR